MKSLERVFEGALWSSRYIVILAVIASISSSIAMFYLATVDAFYMIAHLAEYASPALDVTSRNTLRGETITHVVEVVDGYLLATVLMIFALGLYELFISKIDQAERSETSSNVLLIHSLDDLKSRLAKVILMILIVKYFEHVIELEYDTSLELLYLAAGISLIGLALYLSHAADHPPADREKDQPHQH